jgi:uncharacterized protein YndB with AHSA1/START domain
MKEESVYGNTNKVSETQENQLVITCSFNASRSEVFRAWAEAARIAQWWDPKGSIHVNKLDFRPGGIFHYSMHIPGGTEIWGRFVYQEMLAPGRLVFLNCFADEKGNPVPNPFAAIWPLEVKNTMTLTERDGKTILLLISDPHNATEEQRRSFDVAIPLMKEGLKTIFDKLGEYLAGSAN